MHDPIPPSYKPSKAYWAGFIDGDGSFSSRGKNSISVAISQGWRPICDCFAREYDDFVVESYRARTFWYQGSVCSRDTADKCLKDIQPFIVGKKKQVELLLGMEKDEGPRVEKLLGFLRGDDGNHPGKGVEKVGREWWTNEEEDRLMMLVKYYGFQWKLLSTFFDNKSCHQCRTKWDILMVDLDK